MVTASGGDVTAVKVELPEYTARIDCAPSGMVPVVSVAVPELSVAVPRVVPPAVWNVTVPVGVPDPEAAETIAVSVIGTSANGLVSEAVIVTAAFPWLTTTLNGFEVLAVKL